MGGWRRRAAPRGSEQDSRVRSPSLELGRTMESDMKGWWCVRYGDALACVEAPSAGAALRRSLDLYPLGDWTDDARNLVVFPQDAYPEHAGPHDYTRAVLNADGPSGSRSRNRGSQSPTTPSLRSARRAARPALGPAPCSSLTRPMRRGPVASRRGAVGGGCLAPLPRPVSARRLDR